MLNFEKKIYTVRDVLQALEIITMGRVIGPDENPFSNFKPFMVMKSSHIPGKSVMEIPGLVYGRLDDEVRKIGVVMTITEVVMELAGGIGINVIVAHHPFADAANFGGVLMRDYCNIYGINVIEAHEAFHGRHPGISFLHGYRLERVDLNYGGIPGNVIFFGEAFPEIKKLSDIISRLEEFFLEEKREQFLQMERDFWDIQEIHESVSSNKPVILFGTPDSKVHHILHIFPHTGFTSDQLVKVYKENPNIDTLIASVSRVKSDSPLVQKAKELGLNFLLGNSHALEIYENGIPLAKAIERLIPEVPIYLIEQRVTAVPVDKAANIRLQEYGKKMADILVGR